VFEDLAREHARHLARQAERSRRCCRCQDRAEA
jgi:hypothetical protein